MQPRRVPAVDKPPAILEARRMARARAAWKWLYGQAYLLLALTALMWGGNAVASRFAVGHISPMALTFLRWLVVCIVLAPFMGRPLRAQTAALLPRWRYIVAMAAFGFTTFNALMYAAAHHTSAVNLTIVQGAVPVLVLLGSLLWFRTRIRLVQRSEARSRSSASSSWRRRVTSTPWPASPSTSATCG